MSIELRVLMQCFKGWIPFLYSCRMGGRICGYYLGNLLCGLFSTIRGSNEMQWIDVSLYLTQNCCHFADIFKCIFFNENVWLSLTFSLNFAPKVPIDNIPALIQIMGWHRTGDTPLSEPMTVDLLTHICVDQSQWVKCLVTINDISLKTADLRAQPSLPRALGYFRNANTHLIVFILNFEISIFVNM